MAYSFLSTTVRSNKEYFTKKEIQGADRARILQGDIAWPSTRDFKHYIADNLIVNCTVTVDDVSRAEATYGQ